MNKAIPGMAATAATLLLLNAANAQTPAAATPPPAAATTDPLLLPGDNGLPSMSFMLHPTAGPPPGMPREGPDMSPSVPMNLAYKAARAGLAACAADGHKIGVAVVDAAGHLRVGLNADGAPAGRIYMAVRKGFTAVTFKKPTSEVHNMILADPSLQAQLKPSMAIFPGAVPLMAGDKILGAIAASGASSEQDEKCAAAGAAAIKASLK